MPISHLPKFKKEPDQDCFLYWENYSKYDFLLIALIHGAPPCDLSEHILDFWKCKFEQKQGKHC